MKSFAALGVAPDLAEALAAAEDALSSVLGHPVTARAKGRRCIVELEFESPAAALEYATRALPRAA